MEDAAAPTCDSQMTDAANAALTEPPDDDASIHSSPADAGVEAAPAEPEAEELEVGAPPEPGAEEEEEPGAEEEEEPVEEEPTAEESEAPPDGKLSEEQKEHLLQAIEQMRRATKNVNTKCLGWTLCYTLRKQGGSTRGDMMVVDPADGQKLYSVVSVKRKLGLAGPAPVREPSADVGEPSQSRRAANWDWDQVRCGVLAPALVLALPRPHAHTQPSGARR